MRRTCDELVAELVDILSLPAINALLDLIHLVNPTSVTAVVVVVVMLVVVVVCGGVVVVVVVAVW